MEDEDSKSAIPTTTSQCWLFLKQIHDEEQKNSVLEEKNSELAKENIQLKGHL